MPASTLHYYRCFSCCHVAVCDGKIAPETRCMCDGKLELLGRVSQARRGLVRDSERCACDARCTNAPGPSCDCRCGGENHGTGRTVPIIVDAGGVPRVRVDCEAECRARAEEYRAAAEPIRERLREMRRKRAGQPHPFDRPTPAEAALSERLGQIYYMRTHKGRMRALAALA